ncbi:uncharacterized protein LOC144629490 isoform X2 [Oculina patagonica]
MLQAKQSCDKILLTQQLRRYSADHVKIAREDTDQAKRMVDNYIKNEILRYISSNSPLPISKQEYTGSLYERLKTEAADEVDVMVVLQTGKHEVIQQDAGVPGFVLLKVEKDSPLQKYTNADGYIIPEKLRASWFFGLVQKAVNELTAKSPSLPVELEVRAHGPAVQLDITDENSGKKLSADLVPSFQLGATDYFVAKSYTGKKLPPCDPKLLWRQSFSLREKARLRDMDKEDDGCRHELLKIVKTIIRAEPTFAKLTSYHLKTVFLHYNSNPKLSWGKDMLGERFIEYVEMLYAAVARKTLDHFWIQGVNYNLLDNIQDKTLDNMADRLRRILDSDKERNKVLKCQSSVQLATNGKTPDNCPVPSPGQQKQCQPNTSQTPADLLQLLRRFLDNLGATVSKEIKWSKEVVDQCLKDGVLKYCQENSDLISKFDYGGSLYENLKIMGPDEGDAVILVALKAKKGFITSDVNQAGYAVIKALEGSPYKEFSNEDGFLIPVKFKNWLFKLVNSAVQSISKGGTSSVSLKVSSCSTGVKVQIQEQSKALEVQLVPAFQLGSDHCVPPPTQHGYLPAGVAQDTAWVKSYTLIQKSLLKDMDKDHGCRHDLFKVVNTVLQREPTFSRLTSFHLKMALLWYNKTASDWGKDDLADRFTEFVAFLRDALQQKVLKHFWIEDLNLLTDIPATTLGNMHTRLSRILSSEQERSKVLKVEGQ